ncbi:MAG: hypothetical protein HRT89_22915 [Lentisphaeria bacterium]|nr:hypothetical protein [Lentisphaeria bacterium]NQZ70913.1 hypothetical protein [Lentisphaeria bacterium]
MKEFHRVLKSDGWAILLVPICDIDKTFEDASIVDPQEREKVFGEIDHVRNYGSDYVDRLKSAGFSVDSYSAKDLANPQDIVRMGLNPTFTGAIFLCTK